MPALLVFVLILGFPVLEAWVLVRLAERFGAWVLVWLMVAAAVGIWLIRTEKALWTLRLVNQLRTRGSPFLALLASARVLMAGVLLVFPGVVSDVLALVLLAWPARGRRGRNAAPGPEVIEGDFRREDDSERLPRKRR